MTKGEAIVMALFDCWRRSDLAGAVALLADNAVFVPDPKSSPTIGREAISAIWSRYMTAMQSYACEVRRIVASGPIVVVERVERIELARGVMTLPIVGIFELDAAGRITAWRDYWDTAMAGVH